VWKVKLRAYRLPETLTPATLTTTVSFGSPTKLTLRWRVPPFSVRYLRPLTVTVIPVSLTPRGTSQPTGSTRRLTHGFAGPLVADPPEIPVTPTELDVVVVVVAVAVAVVVVAVVVVVVAVDVVVEGDVVVVVVVVVVGELVVVLDVVVVVVLDVVVDGDVVVVVVVVVGAVGASPWVVNVSSAPYSVTPSAVVATRRK
jgi:hypothetical protein